MDTEERRARYKQGQCPDCGKTFGESNGLEYRQRSDDLYCHSCKKPWALEMDLEEFRLATAFPEEETLCNQVLLAGVVSSPNPEELPKVIEPARLRVLKALIGLWKKLVQH